MDRLSELARHGKVLADEKLVIGAGGNISEKDGDSLLIKRRGSDMSAGDPEAYSRVSFAAIGEEKEMLSSETPLHVACYGARKDVGAVAHVHSPYMVAAAARTALLESPSYEFDCVINGPAPVVDYIQPGSEALAEAVALRVEKGANAVLLKRHGAVLVGADIAQACLRAVALERACVAFLHT